MSAIESLDHALLVDAENSGLIWRVEVETNHVGQLFDEPGVLGELEGPYSMGIEAMLAPDPLHGGGADTDLGSHAPATPMGGVFRQGVQGQMDDLRHLLGRNRARPSPALTDLAESLQTLSGEALAPLDDGDARNAQVTGDRVVGAALSCKQDDVSSSGDDLGCVVRPTPGFERVTLFWRDC